MSAPVILWVGQVDLPEILALQCHAFQREAKLLGDFHIPELFASRRSLRNRRLYERAGYRRFSERQAGERLQLIYLQKQIE